MSVSKCICCRMASAPFCSPAAFGYFFFSVKKDAKAIEVISVPALSRCNMLHSRISLMSSLLPGSNKQKV